MTTAYAFPVKQQVKVAVEFKNEAGVLTDPTTVVAKVRTPVHSVSTVGVVEHPSTGKYFFLLTLEEAGNYYVRWEGTGALNAAVEEVIRARQTEFY